MRLTTHFHFISDSTHVAGNRIAGRSSWNFELDLNLFASFRFTSDRSSFGVAYMFGFVVIRPFRGKVNHNLKPMIDVMTNNCKNL